MKTYPWTVLRPMDGDRRYHRGESRELPVIDVIGLVRSRALAPGSVEAQKALQDLDVEADVRPAFDTMDQNNVEAARGGVSPTPAASDQGDGKPKPVRVVKAAASGGGRKKAAGGGTKSKPAAPAQVIKADVVTPPPGGGTTAGEAGVKPVTEAAAEGGGGSDGSEGGGGSPPPPSPPPPPPAAPAKRR